MIFVCVCVCEFSDGKGGKEAKGWTPEWGEMWGPKSSGNRPSGPPVSQRLKVSIGSGIYTEGE